MDITRELRISETGRPYLGDADLVDHILETAGVIVTEAALEAGIFTGSAERFAERVGEVAAAMTDRICRDAIRAGRPQVADAVRAAWDSAA
jgi:hypothetical protein